VLYVLNCAQVHDLYYFLHDLRRAIDLIWFLCCDWFYWVIIAGWLERVAIFIGYRWRSPIVVFSSTHEGFSHAVNILAAFVLSLTHVDVGDYFPPAGFLVEFGPICPDLLFFPDIVCCPLFFFLFLLFPVLLELSSSLFLSLFLFFPFLILDDGFITLFYLS